MSARVEGSWQQFRAAVEELHIPSVSDIGDDVRDERLALPLYRNLQLNFQRLGHAEFFAETNTSRWRVTPPTLAVTQRGNTFSGILIGARSPKLLGVLEKRGRELMRATSIPDVPDQVFFASETTEPLEVLAREAGVTLQYDTPTLILACLPKIDSKSIRSISEVPVGKDWDVDRFSIHDLAWRPSRRADAVSGSAGLFRFVFRYQRHMLFTDGANAYSVPGQVGKFLMLKKFRRRVLKYDRTTGDLSIPASCRPPFLIERALIMCSGELPQYDRPSGVGILTYTNISIEIARLSAALLCQRLF
jgi:hypothetical protein